jgi:hypothetical protein
VNSLSVGNPEFNPKTQFSECPSIQRIYEFSLRALISLFAWQAIAQQPQKPEPKKHHHKVAGVVMVVSGAALVGIGAFALTRSCPAEERAQQISQIIGQTVSASYCGPSWLQRNKTVIGASATGAGAALVVSGIVLMRK